MYRDNQKKSDRIKFILILNKEFSYEEIAEILLVFSIAHNHYHILIKSVTTEDKLFTPQKIPITIGVDVTITRHEKVIL